MKYISDHSVHDSGPCLISVTELWPSQYQETLFFCDCVAHLLQPGFSMCKQRSYQPSKICYYYAVIHTYRSVSNTLRHKFWHCKWGHSRFDTVIATTHFWFGTYFEFKWNLFWTHLKKSHWVDKIPPYLIKLTTESNNKLKRLMFDFYCYNVMLIKKYASLVVYFFYY